LNPWTNNGAVAVEIGPKEFVERSGLKLGSGQMVTVVGMHIVISHRAMVLARENNKRWFRFCSARSQR
jgi:hypothetical protein